MALAEMDEYNPSVQQLKRRVKELKSSNTELKRQLLECRNAIIEECALELCNFEAGNLAYLIRRLKKD